jgi:hypothetical protein
MRLQSGSLTFSDVLSHEEARHVMHTLIDTLFPLELYYFTKVEGTPESGTTFEFKRRSRP